MRKHRENWKQHIAKNFDRATNSYEARSPVQKKTAHDLATLIHSKSTSDKCRHILELGCGTGHLTRKLHPGFTGAKWLISDISPQMVATCMKSMPEDPDLTYTIMDAEELDRTERFDLICSNLTAQWFTHTGKTMKNFISHLKPGGLLAFTTLGPDTFALWRESFEAAGKKPLMPEYPSQQSWLNMLGNDENIEISSKTYMEEYNSAYDFARALKDIGAHSHGHQQLSPGLVRRVLREFEERHEGKPVYANYEVFFIICRKPLS